MKKTIKLVGFIEVKQLVDVEYDGTEEDLVRAAQEAIFENEAGSNISEHTKWSVNEEFKDCWLEIDGWQNV